MVGRIFTQVAIMSLGLRTADLGLKYDAARCLQGPVRGSRGEVAEVMVSLANVSKGPSKSFLG